MGCTYRHTNDSYTNHRYTNEQTTRTTSAVASTAMSTMSVLATLMTLMVWMTLAVFSIVSTASDSALLQSAHAQRRARRCHTRGRRPHLQITPPATARITTITPPDRVFYPGEEIKLRVVFTLDRAVQLENPEIHYQVSDLESEEVVATGVAPFNKTLATAGWVELRPEIPRDSNLRWYRATLTFVDGEREIPIRVPGLEGAPQGMLEGAPGEVALGVTFEVALEAALEGAIEEAIEGARERALDETHEGERVNGRASR